jgi:hypothetical protein
MSSHRRPTEPKKALACPGPFYGDTTCLLKKGQDPLKWVDVFKMFKLQEFPVNVEDQDEL